MDSDVNLQREIDQQQRVTQVRHRRRKNGILQYNVVYSFGSTEKGKWISLEDPQNVDKETMSLINQYDEIHPFRKYQLNHQKVKKVTEIIGIVSDNKEPRYVVKLEGSNSLEAVHSSYLYKFYKSLLLDFFESKIEFDHSQPQISNSNKEISQQPLSQQSLPKQPLPQQPIPQQPIPQQPIPQQPIPQQSMPQQSLPQQSQTNIPVPNSLPSSSQLNHLLQQFQQATNNNQNDQKRNEPKTSKPVKQKSAQFQVYQQQQKYLQMFQQMQVPQPSMMNAQVGQFPQQGQTIQPQIQNKQQKKMQKSQQQQASVFYTQNMPVQAPFAMQPSQNMLIGKMGSMINFQNVQQVPHQMQGNQ